jgi:hypothetical protein
LLIICFKYLLDCKVASTRYKERIADTQVLILTLESAPNLSERRTIVTNSDIYQGLPSPYQAFLTWRFGLGLLDASSLSDVNKVSVELGFGSVLSLAPINNSSEGLEAFNKLLDDGKVSPRNLIENIREEAQERINSKASNRSRAFYHPFRSFNSINPPQEQLPVIMADPAPIIGPIPLPRDRAVDPPAVVVPGSVTVVASLSINNRLGSQEVKSFRHGDDINLFLDKFGHLARINQVKGDMVMHNLLAFLSEPIRRDVNMWINSMHPNAPTQDQLIQHLKSTYSFSPQELRNYYKQCMSIKCNPNESIQTYADRLIDECNRVGSAKFPTEMRIELFDLGLPDHYRAVLALGDGHYRDLPAIIQRAKMIEADFKSGRLNKNHYLPVKPSSNYFQDLSAMEIDTSVSKPIKPAMDAAEEEWEKYWARMGTYAKLMEASKPPIIIPNYSNPTPIPTIIPNNVTTIPTQFPSIITQNPSNPSSIPDTLMEQLRPLLYPETIIRTPQEDLIHRIQLLINGGNNNNNSNKRQKFNGNGNNNNNNYNNNNGFQPRNRNNRNNWNNNNDNNDSNRSNNNNNNNSNNECPYGVCRAWYSGRTCNFGDRCKYQHSMPDAKASNPPTNNLSIDKITPKSKQ